MKPFNKFLFLAIPALTAYLALAQFQIPTANYSVQKASLEFAKTNPPIDKSANNFTNPTLHKAIKVNGLDIFYREAGSKNNPTILLLHGYPTSSHMFRNLIADLSDKYHLIAPDYPGYGNSEQPPMASFDYTFDNMALIVEGFLEKLEAKKNTAFI